MTIRHDSATCGLCARLAAGYTKTVIGNDISPFCERCNVHHFANYQHLVKSKRGCPRCGQPRFLQDIPESARWERKAPAPYCEECLVALGYVLIEHTVLISGKPPYEARWYELPAHDEDARDPFTYTGKFNGSETKAKVRR